MCRSRILLLAIITLLSCSSLLPQLYGQTDTWIGDVNGSWFSDSNWVDGTQPTLSSDVVVNAIGSDYRVDVFGNTAIDSFAMSSTNATVFTRSLGGLLTMNVTNDIDIFAGRLVAYGSYDISAGGSMTNHGGIIQSQGHTLTNIHNSVLNKSGGTIKVSGNRSSVGSATFGAQLVINGDLNNQGHVELHTNTALSGGVFSTLTVNGTFDNTGLIDSQPFSGGGAGRRTIEADVFNNHANVINSDTMALKFTRQGSVVTNSSLINAAVGDIEFVHFQSLTNNAPGEMYGTNMRFEGLTSIQSTVTNSGSINLSGDLLLTKLEYFENAGDVQVGGQFKTGGNTYRHKSGATIAGTEWNATNTELDLENGMEVAFDTFNLSNATVIGSGVLKTSAGTTTTMLRVVSNSGVDWENHGVAIISGTSTISFADVHGKFTNKAAGELKVRGTRSSVGSSRGGVTLRLHGGLDNEGLLNIETHHGGGAQPFSKLEVTGTFNNSGVLASRPFEGFASGVRSISADVFNNTGTVEQNDTGRLDFNKSSATYSNSGSIDVNAGELAFLNVGSFSNSGEINLADAATFEITGSSFTNEVGGSINGTGEFKSTVASFIDNGLLMPGQSPGVLDLNVNNYLQSTLGILEMEIGGLGAGLEYDQLNIVGGSATFNGTLRLKFIDGFAANMGDEFDLILGSATANFSDVEVIGLQDGYLFDTTTSGSSFTLTALNNTISSVPEPGISSLLGLAALGLAFRRRKRN